MNKWLLRAKKEVGCISSYRSSMISCCDCDQIHLNRPVISDKRNPTSLMTVVSEGEFQILPPYEEELIVTTKEWNQNEKKYIEWFNSELTLPRAPFELKLGVTICDSQKYLKSLKEDIDEGPTGPRSLFGALQDDLINLQRVAYSHIQTIKHNDNISN